MIWVDWRHVLRTGAAIGLAAFAGVTGVHAAAPADPPSSLWIEVAGQPPHSTAYGDQLLAPAFTVWEWNEGQGVTMHVTQPGSEASYVLDMRAPTGQVLQVGDYAVTGTEGTASMWIAGTGTICPEVRTFRIDELTRVASSGALASLAATLTCDDGLQRTRAVVRFHSDVPVATRAISSYWLNFPPTTEGTTSAAAAFTVTNTGAGPIDLGEASIAGRDPGDFAIEDDGCSNGALPAAASCAITVHFAPHAGAAYDRIALLRFPDTSAMGQVGVALAGRILHPTTIAIQSSVNPNVWSAGGTRISTTITPVPDGGTVVWYVDGVEQERWPATQAASHDVGYSSWAVGHHVFTAAYLGNEHYAGSVSGPVDQVSYAGVQLVIGGAWTPGTTSFALIGQGTVWGSPGTGPIGVLELVDETTGETLATTEVAGPGTNVTGPVTRSLETMHTLRATFTSSDPWVKSATLTKTVGNPVTIESRSIADLAPGSSPTIRVHAADAGAGITSLSFSHTDPTIGNLGYKGAECTPGTNGVTCWSDWELAAPSLYVGPAHFEVCATDAANFYACGTVDLQFEEAPPPPDTAGPETSIPFHRLTTGSVTSAGVPVLFDWEATDPGSGVATYAVALSTDGGRWVGLGSGLTAHSLTRRLAPGHAYRLRAMAVDLAGNAGAWSYGPTFKVGSAQESRSSIAYRGTWRRVDRSPYWRGANRYATTAGARATFTTTGRSFAWVAALGPGRGSAQVYVDGVLVKTVSLYKATTGYRRVVFVTRWPSAGSRTVQIRVLGTRGHPRVDLDGFAWSS